MSDVAAATRWAQLATGPCPAPEELLLVAAELLGDPAAAGTHDALDDQSRVLFGSRDRVEAATRLTVALEHDLGYRLDAGEAPELLSLTRVVQTRLGHPLLVAVVAAALLRRAGHSATVCHADGRWLAAATGSPLVVIDVQPGERPDRVRPVCGHLVGFATLSALRRTLEERGQALRAAEVDALLGALPVEVPPR